jgi:hypothetical protein
VLKAGADTAEWAHDRADVLPNIRHNRAPIFDSNPGAGFQAHRYWSRVDLKTKAPIARLEIANVCSRATLTVFKVTAYDSAMQDCALLTVEMPDQWRKVYDQNGARIYENPRAAPRAWIVGHAEAVNEQEALRRIRGEDDRPFDPRRTALLEIEPERLPPELRETPSNAPNSTEARVVNYEPNRFTIEAGADRVSALVVSEINYPGWEATIDGQPAPIFTADYLLRAVITPAGKHRVEMRYTAPAARRGAIISALTLLALLGGVFFSACGGAMRIRRLEAKA